jgi:hypothetical protein
MTACANCGTAIPEGEGIVIRGKDRKKPIILVCPTCASEMERTFQAETESPNVLLAVLLGLAAALACSLVWYGAVVLTNYELGILALGVGWLVAQAVILGSGKKRGPILQVISAGITLLAMIFSEYLIVRHFIVEALSAQGYSDFKLFLSPGEMLEVVFEGIKANPLTLLFWGIALFEAAVIPARRRLQRQTVKRLP